MNIEGLKLILETLSAAGEGAFTIFVIWIGVTLLKEVLLIGVFGFVAWLASKVIHRAITAHSFSSRIGELFGECDVSYHGPRQRVYEQIKALLALKKK